MSSGVIQTPGLMFAFEEKRHFFHQLSLFTVEMITQLSTHIIWCENKHGNSQSLFSSAHMVHRLSPSSLFFVFCHSLIVTSVPCSVANACVCCTTICHTLLTFSSLCISMNFVQQLYTRCDAMARSTLMPCSLWDTGPVTAKNSFSINNTRMKQKLLSWARRPLSSVFVVLSVAVLAHDIYLESRLYMYNIKAVYGGVNCSLFTVPSH